MRRIAGIILFLCFLLLILGQRGPLPAMGEDAAPMIALTFDDGPGQYTESLAEGLRKRQVKATFFVLGREAERYPALLSLLSRDGHEIGSHGWDHQYPFTALSAEDLERDLSRSAEVIREITGRDPTFIRPPYGSIDRRTAALMDLPVMLWTVDTRDWAVLDSAGVRDAILAEAAPLSVIIMHDAYETTVEGVLAAVDVLLEQGYAFVTLTEYYERLGIAPQTGTVYRGDMISVPED